MRARACLLVLPLLMTGVVTSLADDALLTVAEKSDFQATARHDDVLALSRALDERSEAVQLDELGLSGEGRSIPMLIVSDSEITTPAQARQSGRLVVLLLGNIHAGEVCGKEALLMLVRELVESGGEDLLDDLVLLVVPNLNPDGNERVSPDNRPGQNGPAGVIGQRGNASNLDLNRDFVKLQTPEIQALVHTLNQWDPHLIIDTHTTNGSLHRYVLTYQGPQNPAGDPRIIQYTREILLPAVDREFEARTGRRAYFYGDFDSDHKQWTGYPDTPRFGTNYMGMRNRIALLSEAYAYAPYKDRVFATRDFVRSALEFVAEHKQEITTLLEEARDQAQEGTRTDLVSLRSKPMPVPRPEAVLGYVETQVNGKKTAGEPKDYAVDVVLDFRPARTVKRPYAYLVPARFGSAIENLRRHGLELQRLRESVTLDTSAYPLEQFQAHAQPYQGRSTLLVDAADQPQTSTRMIEAGTVLVPTSQGLGHLACYLLEPDSEDGLALWNFLGDDLKPGDVFPVLRLEAATSFSLLTTSLPPLPQDLPADKKRINFETTLKGPRPNFFGSPTSGSWIDDAHYLTTRDRKLQKVEARTGRMEPFHDEAALAKALAGLPTISESAAKELARLQGLRFDAGHGSLFAPRSQDSPLLSADHQTVLFSYQNDLYLAAVDGSKATRLTSSPGQEEFPEFSPDGKFVAFVRDNDLYVVETATGIERALTTGGTDQVRRGKADWVYYEEIFNRNWKAFWWSPDSKRIAFMEFDDHPIGDHVVLNDATSPRLVEETPYPRSGEPNPHIRLGIVSSAGGEVAWADTSDYSKDSFLISGVGWWSDGSAAYCYAQNRTQSWLDLLKVKPDGTTSRLFRETTGAWVENSGNLIELEGGDFLFPSERTGWKHLYRYTPDGQTCQALTSGEWEVESLEAVDQKDGWLYFTASKEGSLADHLYRVPLKGGEVQRLTSPDATHSVKVSPAGSLFLDTASSRQSPPHVALLETDGGVVRVVDENPVPAVDEYDLAPSQRIQIPARDGFLLEAELTVPHDVEPDTLYPVWFMTYGGPDMPTVSDGWPGGRLLDQALATEGFVAFRVDPRSASGKGAASAHTAYKQLGVQELQDIEDAIEWLKREKPFVDGSRIGMAGHSYGGYMTAYAMTHSKLFAAGIAGAPVTDWRDYDSIYTERYMLTPQENPEGYKASSVVEAAANLHGRLLIAHGTIDDNVSLRNTMRLVQALQRADKDFELMLYPSSRHGIMSSHYSRLQLDFIKRTLGGPRKVEAEATGDR